MPTGRGRTLHEIYRQAGTGGVLLSSMGNPKPFPVYWDKILINASQVTNPSIDPLREPMETRTFLGKKPDDIERDEKGELHKQSGAPAGAAMCRLCFRPCPTVPSATTRMRAWHARRRQLGTYYNTGEGGLHEDFYQYGPQYHRTGGLRPVWRAQGLSGGGRGD